MLSDSEKKAAKRAAGKAASELVQDGMLVGLGTGTTAQYFIEQLANRVKLGLKISAVATSSLSLQLAIEGGIHTVDINSVSGLDFTADGADEIDPQNRIIKGGGGALLREKIIAGMSREWVVLIDPAKQVDQFGKFPLPLEILPFAYPATQAKIESLGLKGSFRKKGKTLTTTDNGNYIFDIHLRPPFEPEKLNDSLLNIPGVLETGFFFNMAKKVIIGHPDGTVEIKPLNSV